MPRIVLGIEYDGAEFCGWQWQPNRRSVQREVENALSKVANHPVVLVCAGRTDAGVHASEQVVHFDIEVARSYDAWLLGGNSNLPGTVRILWVKPAINDFHARYSALARLYRYVIFNRPVNSALLVNRATWCYQPLNAQNMHEAAQLLVGNHDFSSFRAQGCQSKSPFRIVHFIDVSRNGDTVTINICANAFLHHMVRNVVGALVDVGTGRRPVGWVTELLHSRDRSAGSATFGAQGLYLTAVRYDARFNVPYREDAPWPQGSSSQPTELASNSVA